MNLVHNLLQSLSEIKFTNLPQGSSNCNFSPPTDRSIAEFVAREESLFQQQFN